MHPSMSADTPFRLEAGGAGTPVGRLGRPVWDPVDAHDVNLLSSSHTHGVSWEDLPPGSRSRSSSAHHGATVCVTHPGGPVADDVSHCKGETAQPTLPELHPCQRARPGGPPSSGTLVEVKVSSLSWWLRGKETKSCCSRKIHTVEQLIHAPELLSWCSRAWEPQLKSACLRACCCCC